MQPSGAAALLEAAETGSVDEAMRLLDEGVSAFSVDMAGYTALHKCAFMGFTHLASSLIRREPRLIDACDITQNTPLHVAAWTGHVRTASTLLDARANVSASDLAGNTPLHRAVLEGQLGVIEVLLACGADVNAAGSEGSTPLHFAIFAVPVETQIALATMLLSHGALTHIPNRHGLCAAALAKNVGRHRLAETLLAAGSDETNGHGVVSSVDAFSLVLDAVQSPTLRQTLDSFHASHGERFVRHPGGDYPVELATLHAQYAGLVSRHVERALAASGWSWAAAAKSCERGVYEGRCSAMRLRLLQLLVGVDDFEAFFELMAAPSLPAAESGDEDGRGGGAIRHGRWRVQEDVEEVEEEEGRAAGAEDAPTSLGLVEIEGGTTLWSAVNHATPSQPAPTTPRKTGPARSRRTSRGGSEIGSEIEEIASEIGSPSAIGSASGVSILPSCCATLTPAAGSDDVPSLSSSTLLHGFDSRPAVLDGSLTLAGGRIVDGKWLRGKRIGVGSSGEVYYIRDEARAVEFAAKLVVPRDAEAAARLEREIELMRHLQHDHVVQYLGAANSAGDRYILLEYCAGGSVRRLLETQHPRGLPASLLSTYGEQLLRGLHFLHEHMVIHRDLKGENLLFATDERTCAPHFGASLTSPQPPSDTPLRCAGTSRLRTSARRMSSSPAKPCRTMSPRSEARRTGCRPSTFSVRAAAARPTCGLMRAVFSRWSRACHRGPTVATTARSHLHQPPVNSPSSSCSQGSSTAQAHRRCRPRTRCHLTCTSCSSTASIATSTGGQPAPPCCSTRGSSRRGDASKDTKERATRVGRSAKKKQT